MTEQPTQHPPNLPPLLYDVTGAATTLNISRGSLYELIRSNQIVSITIGRRRLISHTALTTYIEHLEKEAAA